MTIQKASLIIVKRGLVIPDRCVLFTTNRGLVTKKWGYLEIESALRAPRIIKGKLLSKRYD